MSFFSSVLSSIIGAIVFSIAVFILSKKVRMAFIGFISKVFSLDILHVYQNKEEVNQDIPKYIDNASFVWLLTTRGNDLRSDAFYSLIKEKSNQREIRVLFANPYLAGENDWLAKREKELNSFDSSYSQNVLKNQVKNNIMSVLSIKKETLQLRLFDYPLIGRIVLTDKYVLFTPMLSNKYIRKSKTYLYSVDSNMYQSYYRLFDYLWSVSDVPKQQLNENTE